MYYTVEGRGQNRFSNIKDARKYAYGLVMNRYDHAERRIFKTVETAVTGRDGIMVGRVFRTAFGGEYRHMKFMQDHPGMKYYAVYESTNGSRKGPMNYLNENGSLGKRY